MLTKVNPRDKPAKKNNKAQTEALDTCYDWFTDDRSARSVVEAEWDEDDKMYTGKHWNLLGPNGKPLRSVDRQAVSPNAVENIAFALVAGQVCEFSQNVDMVDFPVEGSDEQVAVVMTDLKQFIADKNHIAEERVKFLWNLFGHGTGIFEHVWDPTWKGGKGPNKWIGEVRWRSVHPRNIFPDARCGDDIHCGSRIHRAKYVTLEYIRDKYPKYGKLASEDVTDARLVGADNNDTLASQKDRTLLVETWYIGEPLLTEGKEENQGKGLHVIWWCGDSQQTYLGHANYVYYAPGEDARFPFTFRQRSPRETPSVWGYSEYYFIKNIQIIHNKTIETMVEGHIHQSLGQGFFNPAALNEKQQKELREKGTLPGMWFAADDITQIKRVYGNGVPASLQGEAVRLPKAMEYVTGRFDISQGKAPGSITAFRALDLLAKQAKTRLITADVSMTTAYQEVGDYINRLIWENYTERRAYRVIGTDDQNKLYLRTRNVFSLDEAKRVYNKETGEVKPLTEFAPGGQPPEGMVEGVDYEVYTPDLDVRCRTSQQMPSDRMFFMEVAKELYAVKAIDIETFYYVIDHGRFQPWAEVANRVIEQQRQMMAQQQPQAQAPQPQAPQMTPDTIQKFRSVVAGMSGGQAQDLMMRLQALGPEDQQQFVEQVVQQFGGAA